MTTRTCADCPAEIARPHARYCDACRWRHRGKPIKHVWTQERDELLRARYNPRVPGCVKRLAISLSMPRWAVTHRAQRLGLCRLGEDRKPWTQFDAAFLEEHVGTRHEEHVGTRHEEHVGTRHVEWIARKLGRSLTSVVMKLKHLHISRRVRDGLTLRDLELCLGADHRFIERWVREGKLQAAHEGQMHGSPWTFQEDAVLRFMLDNPATFRLEKVDQTWFMGLVVEALNGRLRKSA